MGDICTLLDSTLILCAILLLGSIAGFCSEKTGITNIGIDGTMCFGALLFGIYSCPIFKMNQASLGFVGIIAPLALTMVSCLFIGILHAFACVNLKGDHIIVGTAINVIGLAMGIFLSSPLGKKIYDGSANLKVGYDSTFHLFNGLYGSTLIFFGLALLVLIVLWLIMSKTRVGLRYSAVGENPYAVDAQGISVKKFQWSGVLLSAVLAGFAGALFLLNVQTFVGNVQSLGYSALVILIASGWKLPLLLVYSLIFAVFTAAANGNVLTQFKWLPKEIIFCVPYFITLIVLLFCSKSAIPPAHAGKHFSKDIRE